MAAKAETPQEQQTVQAIEALAAQRGTRPVIFAGVKAAAGWTSGKRVTMAEYDAAVRRFLKSDTGKV